MLFFFILSLSFCFQASGNKMLKHRNEQNGFEEDRSRHSYEFDHLLFIP